MSISDEEIDRLLQTAGRFGTDHADSDELLHEILTQTTPVVRQHKRMRPAWLSRPMWLAAATLVLGLSVGWYAGSRKHDLHQPTLPKDLAVNKPIEGSTNKTADVSVADAEPTKSGTFDASSATATQHKRQDQRDIALTKLPTDKQKVASPVELELQAELAATRSQSAHFYRLAGDGFLQQNNVREAVRCYRLHLNSQAHQLALADDDSWLLMSIKSGMNKGNDQ